MSKIADGPQGRLLMSEWIAIDGYPDYEVSDDGQVRSWRVWRGGRRSDPKTLKPGLNGGYQYVNTINSGGRKAKYIHRLVLEAFAGPCPSGMEACHNDGDRVNNCVGNLRWDSRKNNQADRVKHGTHDRVDRGDSSASAKLTWPEVRAIRSSTDTLRALAERYGVGKSSIGNVLTYHTWKYDPLGGDTVVVK